MLTSGVSAVTIKTLMDVQNVIPYALHHFHEHISITSALSGSPPNMIFYVLDPGQQLLLLLLSARVPEPVGEVFRLMPDILCEYRVS